MNTKELLTELNLTDREATLYLALLETGSGTPTTLAHKTAIKRPTVYLDLESLRRKKLVGLSMLGRRTIYVPESPRRLSRVLDEQQKTLQHLLPALLALEKKGEDKPQVRLYDKREDMERVWRKEIWTYAENNYITQVNKWMATFPGLIEEFDERLRNRSIQRCREIVTAVPSDVAYAKRYAASNHHIRIMPKQFLFELDMSIWPGGVALFSYEKFFFLIITGQAIAKSFQTLFDLAWSSAKRPEEFAKIKKH